MVLKTNRALSILLAAAISLSLAASGCSGRNSGGKNKQSLSIAEQFGLAYAPLQIIKELKLLEKNLHGAEIKWKQLGNTAAIREAMLADEVDAGFMAIPPFLIGWDKGMNWKIACGLSSNPVGLVTNKENINSIKDFTSNDKIAVPQPGSVQHILLSMASEKFFVDSHKLDSQLVTMAHPDGMNALLSGKEISAHFTSPPYLSNELKQKGMKQVLSGKEAIGTDFTFIVGVASEKLHNKKPEMYNALIKSIGEAIEYLDKNPEESSVILSKAYGMTKDEVLAYLHSDGVEYKLNVEGVNEFADFMKRNKYISKTPASSKEVFWDDKNYGK